MSAVYEEIEDCIPLLRGYARALTRNPVNADDLVQDCICRALLKQHLFVPGTNLRAWLTTIMHNLHVNGRRRSRYSEIPLDFDESPAMAAPAQQDDRMMLRAAERALRMMPDLPRLTLELVIEGHSYDEVSALLGVAPGTVKSRVSRARKFISATLEGVTRYPWKTIKVTAGERGVTLRGGKRRGREKDGLFAFPSVSKARSSAASAGLRASVPAGEDEDLRVRRHPAGDRRSSDDGARDFH